METGEELRSIEKQLTLKEFAAIEKMTVDQKADFFSAYLGEQLDEGLTVYREIASPMSARVMVKDRHTQNLREMVMFGSNNYLGLADNPAVKEKLLGHLSENGLGLGGPPLLNGTMSIHRKVEAKLAKLKGGEDAMLFSSGFAANFGMIRALVGQNDALIMDELSHASIREAAKGVKGSQTLFAHSDIAELEKALDKAYREGRNNLFVVVEGVYSMDGDRAPLDKIYGVTKKYDGFLIVDDAHGTGVLGRTGGGIAEEFGLEGKIDLVMGTFSKALASSGAFIVGRKPVIDLLRFFSKTYFFSASPPPLLAAHWLSSLEVLEESPQLLSRLHENTRMIVDGMRSIGYDVGTESAIIPVKVPVGVNIRKTAALLDRAGVFLNHIEYPAVPLIKQRFRISVMSTHTKDDVEKLVTVFDTVGRSAGLAGFDSSEGVAA